MITLMVQVNSCFAALSDIFQNVQCLATCFYWRVNNFRVAVTKLLTE